MVFQFLLCYLQIAPDACVVWSLGESLLKFIERTGIVFLFEQINATIVELLGGKSLLLFCRVLSWLWLWYIRRRSEQPIVKLLADSIAELLSELLCKS